MSDPAGGLLRVATYNIHRCRGLDGRTRPERIAEVLQGIDADVIALQEVVGAGPRHDGHAQELGAALGMGWVMAPARLLRLHAFGNVVLSRFPIVHHVRYDLSWKTCEPRCCQRVDVDMGGRLLHLYNVHFGTAILERRVQAERLSGIVSDRRVTGPKVVLGDFNEWTRGPASALLGERLHGVDLSGAPAASAHIPRRPAPRASRSHLPCGRGGRPAGGARADAALAHRVGSSAAGGGTRHRSLTYGLPRIAGVDHRRELGNRRGADCTACGARRTARHQRASRRCAGNDRGWLARKRR